MINNEWWEVNATSLQLRASDSVIPRHSLIVDLDVSFNAEQQLVVLVRDVRCYPESSLKQHVNQPALTIHSAMPLITVHIHWHSQDGVPGPQIRGQIFVEDGIGVHCAQYALLHCLNTDSTGQIVQCCMTHCITLDYSDKCFQKKTLITLHS